MSESIEDQEERWREHWMSFCPHLFAVFSYEEWANEPLVEHANKAFIFQVCKRRFLSSAELLGYDSELIQKLKDTTRFDHRILASTLAWFQQRYLAEDALHQLCLPLYGSDDAWDQQVRHWRDWYKRSVVRLSDQTWFCRAVCTAVCLANPDPRGIAAEKELDARFLPDPEPHPSRNPKKAEKQG